MKKMFYRTTKDIWIAFVLAMVCILAGMCWENKTWTVVAVVVAVCCISYMQFAKFYGVRKYGRFQTLVLTASPFTPEKVYVATKTKTPNPKLFAKEMATLKSLPEGTRLQTYTHELVANHIKKSQEFEVLRCDLIAQDNLKLCKGGKTSTKFYYVEFLRK